MCKCPQIMRAKHYEKFTSLMLARLLDSRGVGSNLKLGEQVEAPKVRGKPNQNNVNKFLPNTCMVLHLGGSGPVLVNFKFPLINLRHYGQTQQVSE